MKGLLEQFGLDGGVASHEPVRDKPYVADLEEVHRRYTPPQAARAFATRWRNKRGSVRTDAVLPDPMNPGRTITLTSIFDAVTYQSHLSSPESKATRSFQLPRDVEEVEAILVSQTQPSTAVCALPAVSSEWPPRIEMLGEKVIEGVTCTGTRVIEEPSGLVTERWTCRDLILGLLCTSRDIEGEIFFRLFNLRLTEPNPDLFHVPEYPP